MDSLREIVKIIDKKRLDKIELIDDNLISSEDSLLSKLYNAIKNDLVSNDQDAIVYLYGNNDTKDQQNYRRVKSRLKSRVLNTLYFLDLNQTTINSNYQKVLFEQNKAVQTINILRRNGASFSSIYIITNNFQKAVNYHLYDIAKFYAFELSKYYAISGKQKLFKHYKDLHEEYSFKEMAIQNATLTYYQIQFLIHHSNEKKDNINKGEVLKTLINELKSYTEKAYSYDTQYFYLRSKLFFYEYTGYLDDILQTCDEITLLSSQETFNQPIWKGVAALYRAKAYLSIGQYELGLKELEKDISLFNEGGLNWFTTKEYLLKLAMHQLNVEYAEKMLHEITKHKTFKKMPEHFTQRMFIYKTYLQLLKDELISKQKKSLKIAKLFNDTMYYVNDKSGYFLSLRIIEIIDLLRSGNFDGFYEKCLVIKRYTQKYLQLENTRRESTFIEMLSSIETYNNNKKTIVEKNKELFDKLKYNEEGLLVNDYEILPYHFLWEIIIRNL